MRREFLHGLHDQGVITGCAGLLKRKDGSLVHCEINAARLPADGGLEGYIRDVSSLAAAREALDDRKTYYKKVLNAVQEGIGEIDTEGRLTYANAFLAKKLGYANSRELIGVRYWTCAGNCRRASGGFEGPATRVTCSEPLSVHLEECIPALANTIPNCNADGSIAGFFGSFADISELEEAKKESEHLTRALMAIRQVNRLITKEKNIDRMVQGVCDA